MPSSTSQPLSTALRTELGDQQQYLPPLKHRAGTPCDALGHARRPTHGAPATALLATRGRPWRGPVITAAALVQRRGRHVPLSSRRHGHPLVSFAEGEAVTRPSGSKCRLPWSLTGFLRASASSDMLLPPFHPHHEGGRAQCLGLVASWSSLLIVISVSPASSGRRPFWCGLRAAPGRGRPGRPACRPCACILPSTKARDRGATDHRSFGVSIRHHPSFVMSRCTRLGLPSSPRPSHPPGGTRWSSPFPPLRDDNGRAPLCRGRPS